jgi:hypothetical protein
MTAKKPPTPDLRRLVEEAAHTLKEREAFYPVMVKRGKLPPKEAQRRTDSMRDILGVLEMAAASQDPKTGPAADLISYQGEVMLSNWSETAAAGRKVEFWLPETADDAPEHPFKHYSRRIRGAAGTIFQMVLVEVDDAGEPIPKAHHESKPKLAQGGELVGGAISKHAGRLAKDAEFWEFLVDTHRIPDDSDADAHEREAVAAEYIRTTAGVESRRFLDHSRDAQLAYENRVLHPYHEWEQQKYGGVP